MHELARIGCMFTNINLIFVLLFPYFNNTFQDIIRASTFLILVAIIFVWLSGKAIFIYEKLYNSFEIAPSVSHSNKLIIMFVLDIILHLVPFLILGFPHHGVSFLFAYGILLAWYVLVRDWIGSIYVPDLSYDSTMALVGGVSLTSCFVLSVGL